MWCGVLSLLWCGEGASPKKKNEVGSKVRGRCRCGCVVATAASVVVAAAHKRHVRPMTGSKKQKKHDICDRT